ncbi:MAG TPA: hypothetical protein VIV34_01945 [Pseudolabrys sp.]
MPRHRAIASVAFACVAALAVAGCKNSAQVFEDQNEGGWFAKPVNLLGKPDWARPTVSAVNLGPQGPVAPEDMVSADGRCAPSAAALAQAAEPAPAPAQPPAPADRAVGSVAGDLAGAPMPATTQATADPGLQRLEPATSAPQVAGGIALGMTECQAVQRAGSPNNVAIGAGERGERKVVLTYLSGPWPGIYTFNDGRLKVIDRAPEQPKPAKAAPKKKKPVKPKTASHETERTYVQ